MDIVYIELYDLLPRSTRRKELGGTLKSVVVEIPYSISCSVSKFALELLKAL